MLSEGLIPKEAGLPRAGMPLALGSGLLAALALAPFAIPGIMLVALVPLFAALESAETVASFASRGTAFGLVFYGISLSWLFNLTDFSWAAVPAAMLVIGCHSLQLFVGLVVLRIGWRRLGLSTLSVAPFAFVVLEHLRSLDDLAMPWVLVGYGLVRPVLLTQLADVTGVWGLTAWAVAVNAALWDLARRGGARRALWLGIVVLPVLAYDLCRMSEPEPLGRLRVAVIQPNIAQKDKWNPTLATRHIATLWRLTHEAGSRGAELVVWPEAALPFAIDLGRNDWRQLRTGTGVPALMMGVTSYDDRSGEHHEYNSAVLYDAEAEARRVYHKRRLVPVTEGVPFPYLYRSLVRRLWGPGLTAGESDGVMQAPGLPKLGTLICYESVFSDLALSERRAGAEVLVVLTNDAWFGRSLAPFQHASFATVRAIEARTPLARAANTGVSALHDTHGRKLAESGIFQQSVLMAEVPWGAPPSFYVRHGPWLVPVSYAAVLALLGAALMQPRRTAASTRDGE